MQVETSDDEDDSDDVNPGRRRKRQKTTGTRPGMLRTILIVSSYILKHTDYCSINTNWQQLLYATFI